MGSPMDAGMIVSNSQSTKGTNTLFRIAGVGASLAFGAMVGSLFALKPGTSGFSFELNVPTVIAFLVAAAFAWFYWRLVARMATEKAPQPRRRKFIIFSAGIVVVGIVSFLYPLKFVPAEKRPDVFFGLGLATLCLSGIGLVMWKVKRFLEADLKRSEEAEHGEK